MSNISLKSPVGVNGIGRIGKLLVWMLSGRKEQEQIVISTGREIGKSLEDLATYLAYDSTYGGYDKFLFGFQSGKRVEIKGNNIYLNGVKIVSVNDPKCRVAGNIPWADNGVEL
ncbi:MAG TPA: glyceraldehyde 3-phosphate dehydrogenase NAD-binding domain-containing protein, partial [Spirochaetota bacterium]|nr:glyceraldehyde 3-phosphate dehydrogenase NAD-binding domain-containing protein [Spirochaetota bacterium]